MTTKIGTNVVDLSFIHIVMSKYNDKNDGKDDGIIFQWYCQNKTKQTPFFKFGAQNFKSQNFTVFTTNLVIVVSKYNDKNDGKDNGKDDGIIFQWCQNKTKQTPFFRKFGAQNFKAQNFTVFTTNLVIVVSK